MISEVSQELSVLTRSLPEKCLSKNNMKIYAISDTHFNHKKLVEYGRPVDFEEQILKNLSKVDGDLLIHCGDFAIGKDEEGMARFVEATTGFSEKVLVRGNHDNKSDSWYLEHGFDFVCESFSNKYFGKRILFTHIPARRGPFDNNIHGHLHGNTHRLDGEQAELYEPGYHIDLAPEIRNYGPVSLQDLLK